MNTRIFNQLKLKADMKLAQQRLVRAGMSSMGAEQVLQGKPVSSPQDRTLVGRIVTAAALEDSSSLWIRVGQISLPGSL